MLVFPLLPAAGEQFVAADGATWSWDGVKWIGLGGVSTATALPVTPVGNWTPGDAQTALEQLRSTLQEWPETAAGQLRAFYIAANGNDSDDGSKGQPWATIAKVNSFAKQSGDAFMFRGGDTFAGQGIATTISGNATNPIFFRSYGSRTTRATFRPSAGIDGILITNAGHNHISNLVIIGPGSSGNLMIAGSGISLTADGNNLVRYPGNRIINVEASYLRSGIVAGSTVFTPGVAIPGFSDVVIEDCVLHHNINGLIFWGSGYDEYRPFQNIRVRNSVAYRNEGRADSSNSGSGFCFGNVDGGLLENCVAYENGFLSNGGPLGIWSYGTRNFTFRFCESYRNMTNYVDGGGFDVGAGNNCIVEYCYSHDNGGPGYQDSQYTSLLVGGNIFRFNITENDGRNPTDWAGCFSTDRADHEGAPNPSNTPSVFHNNVGVMTSDVDPGSRPVPIVCNGSGNTTMYYYNNIFYSAGNHSLWTRFGRRATLTIPVGWRFVGNNYFRQGAGTVSFRWGNNTYNTVAAWRSATNQETFLAAFDPPPGELDSDTSKNWEPGLEDVANGGTLVPPGVMPDDTMRDIFAAWRAYRLINTSPNRRAGLDVERHFAVDLPERDMFGNWLDPIALSIGADCPGP